MVDKYYCITKPIFVGFEQFSNEIVITTIFFTHGYKVPVIGKMLHIVLNFPGSLVCASPPFHPIKYKIFLLRRKQIIG